MAMAKKDRQILRDLAKRVAQIAALPVQAERIRLWKRHNSLRPERPMILVFPEGSWRELMPPEALECRGRKAREIERSLRIRIYTHDHFRDDTVVERTWFVGKAVSHTGWGPEPKRIRSSDPTGAYRLDPIILKPSDLKKLRRPEVVYDEKATRENLALAQDLFDGILDVRLKGVAHVSFHLMNIYIHYRGLGETMLDMYENPGMLHDAMAFLEDAYRGLVRRWRALRLLDLNNDNTYHSSGGNGWTDEMPRHVAQPPSAAKRKSQAGAPVPHQRIEPADMWASAESQELALVSPEMHMSFAMQYESRLLEPFGLTGYGCCEPLERKMDLVLALPRIRRISIAPSADVQMCAEKIGRRAIFSWKPQPSMLVGEFDPRKVRRYIRRTLDAASANGCTLEMILKDTHTCEHHPERFTRWTEIARELVERR
jgi:hypothetical protein